MKILIVAKGDGYGHATRAVWVSRLYPSNQFDVLCSPAAFRMSGAEFQPNITHVDSADFAAYDAVWFDTWLPPELPPGPKALIARGWPGQSPRSDAPEVELIVPGQYEGFDGLGVQRPEEGLRLDMLEREGARWEKGWENRTVIGVVPVGNASRSRVLRRGAEMLNRISGGAVVEVFDAPVARRWFRGCDVLVGGCGWGTCYEALAAEVPLIAVDFGSSEHRGRADEVGDPDRVRLVEFNDLGQAVLDALSRPK